jgi:putative ABC transport system ATP-binding protein
MDAPPPSAPQRGVAIRARGLTHAYSRGRTAVPVLRGIDLDIMAGSHVALQGPSGAGKSTLLSLLGGLEAPRHGELSVGDHDLRGIGGGALASYRRRVVGFVFQHFGLVEVLDARENVMIALSLSRVPLAERRRMAERALEDVGVAHRASHRPAQLSGGERQRVAIARAIVKEPRLLLADEPTGNLDDDVAGHVLDLLESLRREHGCTLLVVTHSELVAERADRRLHLRDGVLHA